MADRILQRWRLRRASKHVRSDEILLDFGCHDGTLLQHNRPRLRTGVGIDRDPGLETVWSDMRDGSLHLLCGGVETIERLSHSFRPTLITALAVLEHLDEPTIAAFGAATRQRAGSRTRLLLTIPDPRVDAIIAIAKRLHLLDGMDDESHHGLAPGRVVEILEKSGWKLVSWSTFQLGLNNEILMMTSEE